MLNEREQAAHDPTIAETAQGLSLAFEKLKADISQSRAARFVLAVLEKLKGAIQTMSKQKQDKQGDGWKFPRPLEIIKCKEGNKEYMKERPARKPYGRIVKVCEFSLEAVAEFGEDDARAVWRLAKRAARDFLRVSWINTAIVTATKTDRPYMAVIVYGKY